MTDPIKEFMGLVSREKKGVFFFFFFFIYLEKKRVRLKLYILLSIIFLSNNILLRIIFRYFTWKIVFSHFTFIVGFTYKIFGRIHDKYDRIVGVFTGPFGSGLYPTRNRPDQIRCAISKPIAFR